MGQGEISFWKEGDGAQGSLTGRSLGGHCWGRAVDGGTMLTGRGGTGGIGEHREDWGSGLASGWQALSSQACGGRLQLPAPISQTKTRPQKFKRLTGPHDM